MLPLAQPPRKDDNVFDDWMYRLWKRISSTAGLAWSLIDKTGANITDIPTRNHADLQNINSTNYTHLTSAQASGLTGGTVTALHNHDFDHIIFPTQWNIGLPASYTLQDLMNYEWSAGIVSGCALTNNGNGTISIASGVGVIRPSATSTAQLYGIGIAAQANIALTDNATNYVYINYNAGTPIFSVSTAITSFNCMDKCIAYMVHRQGNVLHWVDAREQNVDGNRKTRQLFLKFSRFLHSSGGTVLGSPSGLTLSLTSGSFFFMLQEITHIAFDTSVAGTANANTFTLWTLAGATWTQTANQKVIDSTLYNNIATGTVTLGNNKYGVSWVYLINDNPSELHVVMGQVEYPNLAAASAATPPSSIPTLIDGLGSLVGFVAYEKGNTVFNNVFSAFTQTFAPSVATNHNGLAGLQGGTTNEYYHLTAAQSTIFPTGTPTVGQVPIATSATTSAWGTVSGGSSTPWPTLKQTIDVGETCTIASNYQLIVAYGLINSGTISSSGTIYTV